MIVQKSGGKIIGAHLTVAERKAMNMEIQRQLAEYERKHAIELSAMILWVLHEQFGFGPVRLKRFYYSFDLELKRLLDLYELDDSDESWICTEKLKEYGIDISEWERGE